MIYICRSAAVDLAAAFSPPVCEKKKNQMEAMYSP